MQLLHIILLSLSLFLTSLNKLIKSTYSALVILSLVAGSKWLPRSSLFTKWECMKKDWITLCIMCPRIWIHTHPELLQPVSPDSMNLLHEATYPTQVLNAHVWLFFLFFGPILVLQNQMPKIPMILVSGSIEYNASCPTLDINNVAIMAAFSIIGFSPSCDISSWPHAWDERGVIV